MSKTLPTPKNAGHAEGPAKSNEVSNEVKSDFPEGEIEVVANQKGFYNQRRIAKDQKFSVKSFEELGSWMICEDKKTEKLKVEMIEERKAARKKAAQEARKNLV